MQRNAEVGLFTKPSKIVQGNLADTLDLFNAIRKYKVESIVHLAYALYPQSKIPSLYSGECDWVEQCV